MWRDESVTWQVAHRPLGGLWELLGQVDAVHGLYYLLMHGVFALSGTGADGTGLWALRLPSVAATALAAAGVAAIGHRLTGATTGRAAGPESPDGPEGAGRTARDGRARGWGLGGRAERGALFAGVGYALLPPVQMYAQEGRSYALVAAAVVWATYLMLRGRWAAYAVVLALGCWLHEFAVLALPAHAFTAWRSRGWRLAAGAVAVALLPLALVSARQAQQQLGWLGRPSWQDWAAYGAVAAAVLLLARGADAALVRVALPLALLPPGLLLVVSLVHPWYVDRYVLYALAGLALLAGVRLAGSRGRWPWLLIAALLVPAGLWSVWLRTPESRKDDVLAVAAAVRERSRPGDAVLFLPARRREWLLSSPELYGSLRDIALSRTPAASRSLQGVERTPEQIREALLDPRVDRVVALLDPVGQPLDGYPAEAVKRQTLVSSFELCSVTPLRGARVALFARPGDCP
ncbi:glycosyltransferase family 39 protein [Streptomyces sp. NPDC054956]